MKEIINLKTLPKESSISKGFGEIDYQDAYLIKKRTNKTIDEVSESIFELPHWADRLMKTRNSIVKIFGLKTDFEENNHKKSFTLIEKTDNEIITGETDKHLNFRASVLIDRNENTIAVSTVVHYNNVWGKLYFLPVKPFHKIIVKSLLRRELKKND